jgi:diacylglycerol kinase
MSKHQRCQRHHYVSINAVGNSAKADVELWQKFSAVQGHRCAPLALMKMVIKFFLNLALSQTMLMLHQCPSVTAA